MDVTEHPAWPLYKQGLDSVHDVMMRESPVTVATNFRRWLAENPGRDCQYCGTRHWRPRAAFCSPLCATRAWRGGLSFGWDVICDHCGNHFHAGRSDARYCSGRCRVAAHRTHHRQDQS